MRIYLALFSAIFFWGSAFVGITLALESYSPQVLSLGRALVASLIALVVYQSLKQKKALLLKERFISMLLGMLGMGIYSLSLSIGEQTVPAGIAGFIIGQLPLVATILASFFLKEKITPKLWVGIGVSLIGLLLITLGTPGGVSFGSGILCVMLSTFCGAAYTCLQKPFLKKIPVMQFVCHAVWGSFLFLLTTALVTQQNIIFQLTHASVLSTLSVLYLGICPSLIAYIGWTYAISKVNIAKAGLLLYGMPLVGGVLAWLVLSERPTALAFSGMLLALSGSLIGSLKLKPKQKTFTRVSYQVATGGSEDKIASGFPPD